MRPKQSSPVGPGESTRLGKCDAERDAASSVKYWTDEVNATILLSQQIFSDYRFNICGLLDIRKESCNNIFVRKPN